MDDDSDDDDDDDRSSDDDQLTAKDIRLVKAYYAAQNTLIQKFFDDMVAWAVLRGAYFDALHVTSRMEEDREFRRRFLEHSGHAITKLWFTEFRKNSSTKLVFIDVAALCSNLLEADFARVDQSYGCSKLSDARLPVLTKTCTNLTHLDISSALLSSRGLTAILRPGCENLTRLDASRLMSIGNLTVAVALPSLNYIPRHHREHHHQRSGHHYRSKLPVVAHAEDFPPLRSDQCPDGDHAKAWPQLESLDFEERNLNKSTLLQIYGHCKNHALNACHLWKSLWKPVPP